MIAWVIYFEAVRVHALLGRVVTSRGDIMKGID